MGIFSTNFISNVKVVNLHIIHGYSVPSSSHAWLEKPELQQVPENVHVAYSDLDTWLSPIK